MEKLRIACQLLFYDKMSLFILAIRSSAKIQVFVELIVMPVPIVS